MRGFVNSYAIYSDMVKTLIKILVIVFVILGGLYLGFQYVRYAQYTVGGAVAYRGFPFPTVESSPFPSYAGNGSPTKDELLHQTNILGDVTFHYDGIVLNIIFYVILGLVVGVVRIRQLAKRIILQVFVELSRR